jgi:hypothetical protein
MGCSHVQQVRVFAAVRLPVAESQNALVPHNALLSLPGLPKLPSSATCYIVLLQISLMTSIAGQQ